MAAGAAGTASYVLLEEITDWAPPFGAQSFAGQGAAPAFSAADAAVRSNQARARALQRLAELSAAFKQRVRALPNAEALRNQLVCA